MVGLARPARFELTHTQPLAQDLGSHMLVLFTQVPVCPTVTGHFGVPGRPLHRFAVWSFQQPHRLSGPLFCGNESSGLWVTRPMQLLTCRLQT